MNIVNENPEFWKIGKIMDVQPSRNFFPEKNMRNRASLDVGQCIRQLEKLLCPKFHQKNVQAKHDQKPTKCQSLKNYNQTEQKNGFP